jgi:hypothetical protein
MNIEQREERHAGRIFAGIVVIIVGLAALGDRIGFEGLHLSSHVWPFILIALGGLKMSAGARRDGSRRSRRSGAWLVYVGLWGLASEFQVFGLDYGSSWPLLVIGAGVLMVWRAVENPAGHVRES